MRRDFGPRPKGSQGRIPSSASRSHDGWRRAIRSRRAGQVFAGNHAERVLNKRFTRARGLAHTRTAANGLARALAALHSRDMDAYATAAGRAAFSHVDTWVFDLDNTIYSARYNLFELVDARIGRFVADLLDLDAAAARRVQKDYLREHGTTLRGLMLNHGVDPREYIAIVDDIDIDRIPPNPGLGRALSKLDGRKVIFTNATMHHAEKVLARLGVAGHFDGIFDIAQADYVPKPDPEPYATLIARFGIEPSAAAMVEDIARNLAPAAARGMTTVWVRGDSIWQTEGSDGAHVHHVIDDVAEWLAGLVDGEAR